MASNRARFWAVDLHVHTPASDDAKDEDFGTAADIIEKALDAGLDAIAVTDHNAVAWCAQAGP
jgi:predicted metal-dependent phosphoesterase TrpH